MRRIRIGAYLAGIVSAAYLLRTAVGSTLARLGAPSKMGPVKIVVPLVVVMMVGGAVLYLMFSGPHMRVEPKILPYQAVFPALPEGIVPVVWNQTPNLAVTRNPVSDTVQTRQIGQAYYRDYCAFCHGKAGHGDGPVGRSYVPTPTDLTGPAIQGLSDSALYRGMLTGVGHTPVLDYVIDPNVPWYVIHYMRTLRGQE
jgi:mono/diheme cytochrome c family protein